MSEANSGGPNQVGSDQNAGPLAASRREFLTVAGAGIALTALTGTVASAKSKQAAGATIQPAAKAAARTALKDGDPIKIGVIGTGGMGTGHVEAFASIGKGGGVQVVALADPWAANLNNAHDRLTKEWQPGVEVTKYADYKDLLKRADIHAVVIASPEHWHHQHGIDAILAGKDVYCEKPMTLRLTDALALHKVVKANPDMILQVGTQKMALPAYHEARKMIRSGLIGQPTVSQTSYCRNTPAGEWNYYKVDPAWQPGKDVDWEKWCGPLGPQPFDPKVLNRWRRYKKASTGIIGDLLVHGMTPLMMAMDQGWPTRVTAIGGHIIDKEMENHDTVNILVEFETGHQMLVMGATNNETGLTPMIRGPKGNIEVNDDSLRFTPQRPYAEGVEEQRPKLENIGNDQDRHRRNFLNCVRTRTQPESNVDMGLKVMVVVDLATRCLWEGGAWLYDPKTMTATKS